MDGALVRGRTRALYNGSAVVTVVLDGDGGLVTEAQLSTIGIMEDGDSDIEDSVLGAVGAALGKMAKRARRDDAAVREAVRIAVRGAFRDSVGKRPVTTVHVVRL
jgi:ribonuclease J